MVFFGEYEVSFTGQGRIVLPKKIRELLHGGTFVLTKGFDTNLSGYDREDWEKRAGEFMSVSLLDKENIDQRRLLFASTVYIEIDDQGRFVLPKSLLTYAALSDKAYIVGVGDHFEIWDVEKWKKYVNNVKS